MSWGAGPDASPRLQAQQGAAPARDREADGAPRSGFFEEAQYDAVRKKLPADLQVAAAIAYTYGWRTQSEILTRERRHVDLEAGTLRLDPGETKNGEGRTRVPHARADRAPGRPARPRGDPPEDARRDHPVPVPASRRRTHRGTRRRDYRKAWASACTAAGVAGRIRHDFRRTAVRNLERRAVARSVAMKLTGHKTESVYRRYAIVSDADLREAARKLAGTFSGTSEHARLENR